MDRESLLKMQERGLKRQESFENTIGVCQGSGCMSLAADEVRKSIQGTVRKKGKAGNCQVKGVGCLGLCGAGPMVTINKGDVLYQQVQVEDAELIVDSLGNGGVEHLKSPTDTAFYSKQKRVVRRNAGIIDPELIEDYISQGGYQALYRALMEMTPDDVIQEISRSGLRGRGGAGYPTGLKWSTVAKMHSAQKYVVCNGDEGDPGAFMDRSVMEDDPHSVIESMAIAGYAVGADQGYIYVRAEYPLAIQRLKKAIRTARKHEFLGHHIFGTDFDFTVNIRLGAGAFVCGEETALLASIEGKRGTPRPRPPYPAEKGLWGHPTLINNVETYGNIVPIIRNGADWFADIGTEKSKGTKVFALSGKINNVGLIEVPMGISLREIVDEIGGGIPDSKAFKAVQTGGPSGGCIPAKYLDTAVDYESLRTLGSIMGSGGMIIMDETSSMVEVARYFMEFCMSESCGKCIPCRVGTAQMYDLLTLISEGKATPAHLAQLERLCDMVSKTSLCGLGQSAPNPVVSTLRYFREEYESLLQTTAALEGI